MTDEVVTPVEVQEQAPAPQYTEIEQAAIERGWKPKDEYHGDPAKWRSAEVFVALDEPLKRIEAQSKELKRVREALDALGTHHKRVKEAEYNRALKQLQEARKEAFKIGETDQAFAIEDRIEELKVEKENIILPDLPKEPEQQPIAPEFQAWVDSNSWYVSNKAMRAAADAIGIDLHQQGHSPKEVLKLVEQEIRKEFPNKFTNERSHRPNAVESTSRGSPRQSETMNLTAEEKKIMDTILRTGIMTKDEYMAGLKSVKGN